MAFGRLDSPVTDAPMSDINVTPLVDVMLVLLVIFIITAPLMASALRLNLPQIDGVSAGNAPRILALALDAQGQMYWNDAPLDRAQLPLRLREQAAAGTDVEVQIRADQTVPYGDVAQLMAAVQQAGLVRIALVTQPRTGQPDVAAVPKP